MLAQSSGGPASAAFYYFYETHHFYSSEIFLSLCSCWHNLHFRGFCFRSFLLFYFYTTHHFYSSDPMLLRSHQFRSFVSIIFLIYDSPFALFIFKSSSITPNFSSFLECIFYICHFFLLFISFGTGLHKIFRLSERASF